MIYFVKVNFLLKHGNVPNHYVVLFENVSRVNRTTLVVFQEWKKNWVLSNDEKPDFEKENFLKDLRETQ